MAIKKNKILSFPEKWMRVGPPVQWLGGRNTTTVTKFILLGFSEFPKLTIALFAVFLGIYVMTVSWNVGLIILIKMDTHLHTPMYFFLSNLSFLDICYVSTIAPKMFSDFFKKHKFISFMGCITQYFFFSSLGLSECCLLAAMAYNRYAAICNPLLYTAIMSPTLCVQMAAGSCTMGFFGSFIQLCALLHLHFCGPNVINHFFCDLPQLLILSCSDTFFFQVMTSVLLVIFGLLSVLVITVSYGYIIATILRITSAKGRSKAFSTCTSHLTTVTLFFGSGILVYMYPNSGDSLSQKKLASVLYTIIIPVLNPLAYSLRNKEIQDALDRWKKIFFPIKNVRGALALLLNMSVPVACRRHPSDVTDAPMYGCRLGSRFTARKSKAGAMFTLPPQIENAEYKIMIPPVCSPAMAVALLIFLGTYLSTVSWNLGLIILIRTDPGLHTPMYFLLSNLSFLDFCYVTSTTPQMLSDFFQKPKSISFMGCIMQYFFFSSLGLSECCLLAAMAYDRYAAICNPLLYTAIMSPTLCVQMVVGTYITGFFGSLIQLCALLQLNFCGPNIVNHFFCDLPQLLVLSCSETLFLQVMKFVIAVIFGVTSVIVIMVSYGYIVGTILKISTVEGRSKTFNTCVSHLMAVTLFFGSGLFVYMHPSSGNSLGYDKMASVFYTVVIPMLNPLIYSLRNKEIKDAVKRYMAAGRNISTMTGFILLGFSEPRELQIVLFVVFLVGYLMTLAGNLCLIILIKIDPQLRSPMYFFLGNLSFIDISYTSSVTPKMLCDFFQEQKAISFVGCAAQFFFFIGMGGAECCLLEAMAYDRYAAISSPLLYPTLMSPDIYLGLAMAAYAGGFLAGLAQTSSIFQLHFCGPRVINHFFCDLPPLLALACSTTFLSQVVNFLVMCAVGGASALVVLVSYGYIIAAVVKIHSAQGRMKAFSTCASHLTTVILFYGSGLFSYLHSRAGSSWDKDKVVSMFYAAVIPMLNPIIYSLRNKEINDALRKLKGGRSHVKTTVSSTWEWVTLQDGKGQSGRGSDSAEEADMICIGGRRPGTQLSLEAETGFRCDAAPRPRVFGKCLDAGVSCPPGLIPDESVAEGALRRWGLVSRGGRGGGIWKGVHISGPFRASRPPRRGQLCSDRALQGCCFCLDAGPPWTVTVS
ncbi:uncharacterized protein O8D03_012651 [Erethizon dorsatum]